MSTTRQSKDKNIIKNLKIILIKKENALKIGEVVEEV